MWQIRHSKDHQSLLCILKNELVPVIFDGLQPLSSGICDAAEAAVLALERCFFSSGKRSLVMPCPTETTALTFFV